MSIYTHIALVASGLYLTACASTPEKLQGADYYYVEGQKAYEKKKQAKMQAKKKQAKKAQAKKKQAKKAK